MAEYDVVVVGAGFAGLYSLHRLKALGMRVRGLERGGGVGGTWFWNRYPGARCDVESLDYQYSDAGLAREWRWSEKYATQPEILGYLEHAAQSWGVLQDIDFHTELVEANWDAGSSRWSLRTSTGTLLVSRFFIMATGCLSCPQEPNFQGLERFHGRVVSTNNWPREPVDFSHQRVALIGTGSSGIQTAPLVAEQAAQLYVLQRTPNYSMPAHNTAIDPKLQRLVDERWEEYRSLMREHPAGGLVLRAGPWGLQAAAGQKPAELAKNQEAAWEQGGLGFGFQFRDSSLDPTANKLVSDFVRSKICEAVDDPTTASLLQPNYAFGCKRPCVDSGYLSMFNRENVQLVDIKGKSLEFASDGVQVGELKMEVDIVVLAIGFDAMTGSLLKPIIRGAGGKSLKEYWAAGPLNYLGLQVAGFPNFFMCTGPGSPSVLSNMVISIEQHVDWIVDCLETLREKDVDVVEARLESETAWTRNLEEVAKPFVMHWGCDNSWYKGANIPGKPRVFMPYTGFVGQYRAICDAEADSSYPGFVLRKADGNVIEPALFKSWTALPRKVAYRSTNLVKMVRMLWQRGGEDSIVGAAWPDAKIRARL